MTYLPWRPELHPIPTLSQSPLHTLRHDTFQLSCHQTVPTTNGHRAILRKIAKCIWQLHIPLVRQSAKCTVVVWVKLISSPCRHCLVWYRRESGNSLPLIRVQVLSFTTAAGYDDVTQYFTITVSSIDSDVTRRLKPGSCQLYTVIRRAGLFANDAEYVRSPKLPATLHNNGIIFRRIFSPAINANSTQMSERLILETVSLKYTAELHLSRRWLFGSAWPFG